MSTFDRSETYRRVLRISAAVTLCVLVFQSGLIDQRSTGIFSDTTEYLGAMVGMSARVEPNEFNVITAELTKREQQLAAREEAVREREIAVELDTGDVPTTDKTTTYFLAAILFIQLVLIVLNYGLDFLRAKEQRVRVVSG